MRGASRQALAEVRERLDAQLDAADDASVATLADDLLAVSGLLGRERALARALADPGTDPLARVALADALLGERVAPASMVVLRDVVGLRWSSSVDVVDGVERLGAQAAFEASARSGALDEVEDELFRLARIVERSNDLTTSLADPGLPNANKAGLITALLAGKANATTLQLVTSVVTSLRGRSPSEVLDGLATEAASRRRRKIAIARVAVPLDPELRERLETALGTALGHDVRLQVEVDPSVIGGIVVQVGDEVFDGSVSRRLDQVARGMTT